MKLHPTLTILLSLVAASMISILVTGEAQTSIQPDPQSSNVGLRMSVIAATRQDVKIPPVFGITIENVGDKDTVLNLGIMLGNGRIHVPTEIRLILTDSGGKSRELHLPPPRIAGRIDDYAIPLRVGSAYTVKLSLDDFCCPKTKESRLKLKPGTYRLRSELTGKEAQSDNGDMEGMKHMNFWKGTLQSDLIVFHIGK